MSRLGAEGPALPGSSTPTPAPGLTMAAARAGPALPGQRPWDRRPELRDLAAQPAPARSLSADWLGAGPGAGRVSPEAGSVPRRVGRGLRVQAGQGEVSLAASLAACDPPEAQRIQRGASEQCCTVTWLFLPQLLKSVLLGRLSPSGLEPVPREDESAHLAPAGAAFGRRGRLLPHDLETIH